jgi:hypothetical protein
VRIILRPYGPPSLCVIDCGRPFAGPLLAIPLDLHHKNEDEDEDTCAPSAQTNDTMNLHAFKLHSQENPEDSMNVDGGGLELSGSGHDDPEPVVATMKETDQIDQPMSNDEQQNQSEEYLSRLYPG